MSPEDLDAAANAVLMYRIAAVLAALVGTALVSRSVYLVRTGTAMAIERFGRFSHVLQPGLHFLNPLTMSPRRVEWTCMIETSSGAHVRRTISTTRVPTNERVLDLVPMRMLTSDRLSASVNCVLIYRVCDVQRAVYDIDDLLNAIEVVIETALRDAVCDLTLDEAISGIARIRASVQNAIQACEEKWGYRVTRFDLQSITPPSVIVQATENAVRTARDSEAKMRLLTSERESRLLTQRTADEVALASAQADQQRRALAIKNDLSRAEADAKCTLMRAQAEADGVRARIEAGYTPELMTQQMYADAWAAMAQNQNAMVVPSDSARFLGLGSVGRRFARVYEGGDDDVDDNAADDNIAMMTRSRHRAAMA